MPDGSNLDAHQIDTSDPSAHAVEFSKTAAPSREGVSFARRRTRTGFARGGTQEYSADSPARRPCGGRHSDRTRKNSAPAAEAKRPRANSASTVRVRVVASSLGAPNRRCAGGRAEQAGMLGRSSPAWKG